MKRPESKTRLERARASLVSQMSEIHVALVGPVSSRGEQPGTDLTAERDRINRMITDLVRSRDVLDEVIDIASGLPGPDIPGS